MSTTKIELSDLQLLEQLATEGFGVEISHMDELAGYEHLGALWCVEVHDYDDRSVYRSSLREALIDACDPNAEDVPYDDSEPPSE